MRNAKGVTHTARVRAQFHSDELAVLFFTGMTLETLTDLKLDAGKQWITKYCREQEGMSKGDAEEIWVEPDILQWWNLEWRRMDHYVILPILHKIVAGEREAVYRNMHTDIFLSTHPQFQVLELSLMRMMQRRMQKEKEAV
jgi:hypothetical protein